MNGSISLTLHPTLPFIRLFSVQEAEVFVCALDCHEADDEPATSKEGKNPGVVILLFFRPETSSIRKID